MQRGGIQITYKQEVLTRSNNIMSKQTLVFKQNNTNIDDLKSVKTSPLQKSRIGFKSPFPKSVFEANQIIFKGMQNITQIFTTQNLTHKLQFKTKSDKIGCLKNKTSTEFVINKDKKQVKKKVRFNIRQNNFVHQKQQEPSTKLRFNTPINIQLRINSPKSYLSPFIKAKATQIIQNPQSPNIVSFRSTLVVSSSRESKSKVKQLIKFHDQKIKETENTTK